MFRSGSAPVVPTTAPKPSLARATELGTPSQGLSSKRGSLCQSFEFDKAENGGNDNLLFTIWQLKVNSTASGSSCFSRYRHRLSGDRWKPRLLDPWLGLSVSPEPEGGSEAKCPTAREAGLQGWAPAMIGSNTKSLSGEHRVPVTPARDMSEGLPFGPKIRRKGGHSVLTEVDGKQGVPTQGRDP